MESKRLFLTSVLIFGLSLPAVLSTTAGDSPSRPGQAKPDPSASLLRLMGITPSPESIDYIQNKTQFQLHTLLTEQRHPKTWSLGEIIQDDYEKGLAQLFSIDRDIESKLAELALNPDLLEKAAQAVQDAILSENRVYIYGCGATGRLAKQMESTFWRPFWRRVKASKKCWDKVRSSVGDDIEDRMIGEMTGGDRALISSLEGFEDLQLIGRLQLSDRGVQKGDTVFCVTEGGETSSVIGTVLAALDQWTESGPASPQETARKLFFVYNNPDQRLLPFDRSRRVIEEPGITKINLTTGPQAITGSTRMQATTIETFVLAVVLQVGLDRALRPLLSGREMAGLGFGKSTDMARRLAEFGPLLRRIEAKIPDIARFTAYESETYRSGRFSTYLADKGLITVFIDSTERSPTFRLYPLDTIRESRRKCWIQVWTPAAGLDQAWQAFLGRAFRGLSPNIYRPSFATAIDDPYLKKAALESLKNAGDDQRKLYDFSFSESNIGARGPEKGDLGVCILLSPEERLFRDDQSPFGRFIRLFRQREARIVVLSIVQGPESVGLRAVQKALGREGIEEDRLIAVPIAETDDPLGINSQIALKVILNAHSTAVMARLGKVIGNTMTNVSPSNLKLIGRATYLIQSHVNDALGSPEWVRRNGLHPPLSYGEANAVLFECIRFLKDRKTPAGQTAEVALSIIHILECLRSGRAVPFESSLKIVETIGLRDFLGGLKSRPPGRT